MAMDPFYWLCVGPALLLALWAQWRVRSAYSRYSAMPAASGLSGAEAARKILSHIGIGDVRIEETSGWLSDHYDPMSKTLRLSPEIFHGRSISAIGIAAHEAGHALQHAESYAWLSLRTAIVPLASAGSWLAFPLLILGGVLQSLTLVKAGIIAFSAIVLFQFITLPVEFNASARAKDALASLGIIGRQEEVSGVENVLSAAAMTYVAATVSALSQLLYFLVQSGLLSGRDEE